MGKLSIFEIDYENIQIESFIFMKLKTIHSDTVFGNSNYGLELRLWKLKSPCIYKARCTNLFEVQNKTPLSIYF